MGNFVLNLKDGRFRPINLFVGCIQIHKAKIIQPLIEFWLRVSKTGIGHEMALGRETRQPGLWWIKITWVKVGHDVVRFPGPGFNERVGPETEISPSGENQRMPQYRYCIDGKFFEKQSIPRVDDAGSVVGEGEHSSVKSRCRKNWTVCFKPLFGQYLEGPPGGFNQREPRSTVVAHGEPCYIFQHFFSFMDVVSELSGRWFVEEEVVGRVETYFR